MATFVWILIIIVAAIIVAGVVMAARRRRTAALRERFGPEYDRAVEARDDRRLGEAELRDREKQRAKLDIKPLPADARVRFAEEWREVQALFVDQPADAVVAADRLIYRVMETRGYPMGDFDAQADLVSVDHPGVVENYRFAHGVHQRAQEQQASTEDLREALLRYRSLFDELLQADNGRVDATARRGQPSAAGQWDAFGQRDAAVGERDAAVRPMDAGDSDVDGPIDGRDAGSPEPVSRRDGGVA